MNASFPSDSLRSAPVAPERPQEVRHTPSVPISVYRELATELKATQAMVDALTTQNQQLSQQNQLLRQEMLKFADSAAHLKQAVEGSQPTPVSPQAVGQPIALDIEDDLEEHPSLPERLTESMGEGVSRLAGQFNQIVAPKATPKPQRKPTKGKAAPPRPPAKPPQLPAEPLLYTEERLTPSRSNQVTGRPSDFSGLWLATTILLIVVSAFGAGFLIMKPLLSGSE